MAYLYSVLPSRIAIDVGANEGRLSKILLQTGYRFLPLNRTRQFWKN
jgi:hypothetical protein